MKTIEQAAKEYAESFEENDYTIETEAAFATGAAFVQQWISVDDELPECSRIDNELSDVRYSKYILIKVAGYVHPFVGFYVKSGDDEFFDFIHKTIDDDMVRKNITHWRHIEFDSPIYFLNS